MLPQGMFSVAVATVLFPALRGWRRASDFDGLRALTGTGVRQICAAADPGRGLHARARRADHAPRLPARRVRHGLDEARRRGAVLVLLQPAVRGHQPAADAHVLLAPAAVAADRPRRGDARRQPRRVDRASSSRSASPASSSATAISSAAMTAGQAYYLRRELGGRLEGDETTRAIARDRSPRRPARRRSPTSSGARSTTLLGPLAAGPDHLRRRGLTAGSASTPRRARAAVARRSRSASVGGSPRGVAEGTGLVRRWRRHGAAAPPTL